MLESRYSLFQNDILRGAARYWRCSSCQAQVPPPGPRFVAISRPLWTTVKSPGVGHEQVGRS
jgi:hypothetical protein